ncbi:MAG: flavin reductase [Calditrichaeota bacterium]|nr:MAG: flavin reductase [Calditrichota bacterium]
MDANAKKVALRMIPYGLYILSSGTENGRVAGRVVSWVTQASFEPPLLVVAVKTGSVVHNLIKETGAFALNVLKKGQQALATRFFKPVEAEGALLGGEPFHFGHAGTPIIENAVAHLECMFVDAVEEGDHTIVVGKVVDAGIAEMPAGRPDELTLRVQDVNAAMFYGG